MPDQSEGVDSNRGINPEFDYGHGLQATYQKGCRCLACRRVESVRVRAAYESACTFCGGPCWGRYSPGRRCSECVRLGKKHRTLQPQGLQYQWGAP